jgi:ABC-2 type transport system ATP-binding protein
MQAITVTDIRKFYGKGTSRIEALRGLTFSVEEGELFGVIGPDGAGKTSLFRILTTLLLPDQGSATVDGLDVVKSFREVRSRVGYMPGRFSLYQDLTVKENLDFFATIFNTTVEKNYHLIKDIYVQIEPFKDRPAGKLSGGMKQKLALCCALIHEPSVLFLDEPTTGVDAVSRKEFWIMLKELRKKGISILVSTPYMDEAAQCDRVALIQEGRILKIDTPAGITGSFGYQLYSVRNKNLHQLYESIRKQEGVHSIFPFGDSHHLIMKDQTMDSIKLATWLEDVYPGEKELEIIKPTIEDCFMELMNQ